MKGVLLKISKLGKLKNQLVILFTSRFLANIKNVCFLFDLKEKLPCLKVSFQSDTELRGEGWMTA